MSFSKSLSGSIVAFAFMAFQMGCTSNENSSENPSIASDVGGGFISGGTIGAGGVRTGVDSSVSGTVSSSGVGSSGLGGTNIGGMNSGTEEETPPVECGNGIVEPGEVCEPGVEVAKTCKSLGEVSGTVGCDATCHFDVSGCTSTRSDAFTVNDELSSAIGTVGIVTWSTTVEPVTEAYIEFGLDTNYGMQAPVDLAAPEYRTLLLGMKASSEYHFRIVAKDKTSEYQSEDYTLTTGPVTNLAQVLEHNVDNGGARAGGYIVTGLYQSTIDRFIGGAKSALAFIIDADGDIVWWYPSQLSNISRARMSYDGKYMWMISVGNDLVSNGVERVSMDGLDSRVFSVPATHDITAVTGEVMAFLSGDFNGCVVLTEITPDGTTDPIYDTNQIFGGGFCHANAIRYSETEGVYTLSDLGQGDIIWVNRETRSLVQRLSEFSFDWGHHQHGHHLLDNSIVLFNNGLRITQEISLDPSTKQSSQVWQYGTTYNSEVLGDAQRLPNGNTNVTYSTAGRIHEVGPDGQRVMEIRFSASIGYSLWQKSLYGPPSDVIL